MKKLIPVLTGTALSLCFGTTVYAASSTTNAGRTSLGVALAALFIIAALLTAGCVFFTVLCLKAKAGQGNRRRRRNNTRTIILVAGYTAAIITLVLSFVCLGQYLKMDIPAPTDKNTQNPTGTTVITEAPTPEPTEAPTEPPLTLGAVGSVAESDPARFGVQWDILQNGNIIPSYNRTEPIHFGNPLKNSYYSLPGIATFRGDNYRTGSAYGNVNIVNKTLSKVWEREISSILKASGTSSWTGSGWTGQPLVVQWDEETRNIMNLYPAKKAKTGLVEVIYATLDGHIYFYDLEDGSYTRDPMNLGMAFKGAGALDPRGYPLFYVGSGDTTAQGKSTRMYIISLIDCTVLYERTGSDEYRLRSWTAFDSSPLVHGESDTLIWPGESGLLYTFKLNTRYDKAAGTISVTPDQPVVNRYKSTKGGTLGFENSAVIVENYLYVADNGGMLFCIDLNTMGLKWSQFVYDDTNATMVFSWEDGKGYLYTGCSTEMTGDKSYLLKLDAATGAIIWEKCYSGVHYDKNVSGGVLGSPVLGKEGTSLEGLIVYPIGKVPGAYSGILVALDIKTGEQVWKKDMNHYAWSSPVGLYNENGDGYLLICDSGGYVHLLDGKTGNSLNKISVGSNVEASPVVFNNMMVVGTRGQRVYGIQIS